MLKAYFREKPVYVLREDGSAPALVEFAMLATPADPFDPMEKAIQAFGLRWLEGTEHVHAQWSPEFEYALSPDILAMTLAYRGDAQRRYVLATKGAPEAVIDLCHLAADARTRILAQVERMAERGLRVDMHCDESDDPLSRHIETLAFHAQRLGMHGRVTGSHECAGVCRVIHIDSANGPHRVDAARVKIRRTK